MARSERPLSSYLVAATVIVGLLVVGGMRLQEAALEEATHRLQPGEPKVWRDPGPLPLGIITERALGLCETYLKDGATPSVRAKAPEPTSVRLLLRGRSANMEQAAGIHDDIPFVLLVNDKGSVEMVWPVFQPGRDYASDYYTSVIDGLKHWRPEVKSISRSCLVVRPAIEWREG